MLKAFLSLIILTVIVGAAYTFAWSRYSAFNRAGITGAAGRIGSGEKFGTTIGDPPSEAERNFKELGFEKVALTRPQSCHGFRYSKEQTVQLWFDNSWRRGTLCVVSSAQKVTHLSWSYGIGFP